MARRTRKHVPLMEQLAATLACLLPQDQRDDLRARKVPANAVRALFEMHHVQLHCHDGSDRWWNLHPMIKAEHRESAKRDTSIAAKVTRVEDKWRSFTKAMRSKKKRRRVRRLRARRF